MYGDALEFELQSHGVPYEREVKFTIDYKEKILRHSYIADFVIQDIIILEIKAAKVLVDSHIKQTLNYLAASKLNLGILVNFGEDKLEYKRVVL